MKIFFILPVILAAAGCSTISGDSFTRPSSSIVYEIGLVRDTLMFKVSYDVYNMLKTPETLRELVYPEYKDTTDKERAIYLI